MRIVGIILIALSALFFIYKGINYTTKEKVVDIGPVEISKTEHKTIPFTPIMGGVALIGGIALVAMSSGRRTA